MGRTSFDTNYRLLRQQALGGGQSTLVSGGTSHTWGKSKPPAFASNVNKSPNGKVWLTLKPAGQP